MGKAKRGGAFLVDGGAIVFKETEAEATLENCRALINQNHWRITSRGASLGGAITFAPPWKGRPPQPLPDCGGINVVGAGDISLHRASGAALDGFLPLMRSHAAARSTPRSFALAAFPGPSGD
jgi:hypothetical protein